MTKIQEKIKTAFDQLEEAMKAQQHLDEDKIDDVLALTERCSKFWRVLDDGHRDFLNAVRFAIEAKMQWK
jgi:hypothetical protein